MPYATNDGVRLYYEVEGNGPPLVLHIGLLGSLDDWRREDTRYVEALRDTYRLVLLDPRGQGRSDGPHDPAAYFLRQRAGDVLAVLDAEGIARAHFWGYSLGAAVGFALGVYASERVISLVLGGGVPSKADPPPDEEHPWLPLFRQGMPAFVAEWERHDPQMPPAMRERWLAVDAAAMVAVLEAAPIDPGVADAVAAVRTPALLYYGTADYPDRLPDQTAARMANAQAIRRSVLVLPHVRPFLDRVVAAQPTEAQPNATSGRPGRPRYDTPRLANVRKRNWLRPTIRSS